jgi:hypothetical protein
MAGIEGDSAFEPDRRFAILDIATMQVRPLPLGEVGIEPVA